MTQEFKGTVRVEKLQVHEVLGGDRQTRDRWMELARGLQLATNTLWQEWLIWHAQNRSAEKIRAYLDALAEWREKKEGAKPQCEVKAVPAELNKQIRRRLTRDCPGLHSRVRELLQHSTEKKIRQRRAAHGALSGWMAILLCHESIPSATRPQPIPFDRANAVLIPPQGDSDWQVHLRVDRQTNAEKAGSSTLDRVVLRTRQRGCRKAVITLQRIVAGDYKFCGSNLLFDRGKWFVHVCYQLPEQERAVGDPAKTAILWPAHERPWKLRIDRYNWWVGGRDGHHIAYVRQKVLMGRWGRQESYRHAGGSAKGHGRRRALGKLYLLEQAWQNFCRNAICQLVRQSVDTAVTKGCGRIVYLQPARGDRLFVSRVGKIAGRRDATGWPWHQVATQLRHACQQAGLICEVQKMGSGKNGPAGDNGRNVEPVFTDGQARKAVTTKRVAAQQV